MEWLINQWEQNRGPVYEIIPDFSSQSCLRQEKLWTLFSCLLSAGGGYSNSVTDLMSVVKLPNVRRGHHEELQLLCEWIHEFFFPVISWYDVSICLQSSDLMPSLGLQNWNRHKTGVIDQPKAVIYLFICLFMLFRMNHLSCLRLLLNAAWKHIILKPLMLILNHQRWWIFHKQP